VHKQFGHKSAAMTLDVYGHLWPDETERLAEQWTRPTRRPSRSVRGPNAAPTRCRSGKLLVDSLKDWCERRDSNPHGRSHRDLNPARLPVPPRSRPADSRPPGRGAGDRSTRRTNSFPRVPVPIERLDRSYSREGEPDPAWGRSGGSDPPLQRTKRLSGGQNVDQSHAGTAVLGRRLPGSLLSPTFGAIPGTALARARPRCGTARSRRSGDANGRRHASGHRGYPGREASRGGALLLAGEAAHGGEVAPGRGHGRALHLSRPRHPHGRALPLPDVPQSLSLYLIHRPKGDATA
jgi:hypothetical protein